MFKIILILSVSFFSVACIDSSQKQTESVARDKGVHLVELDWDYVGEKGPDKWGALQPEFSACDSGKAQSPIDLVGENSAGLSAIKYHYNNTKNPVIKNNGHTIQIDYGPGSYAIIQEKKYNLLQFHFHSPSEHQIHGKQADLVAHLVHKADDGEIAVIALMFDEGDRNEFLAAIWGAMPKNYGNVILNYTMNVINMLPGGKAYFHYMGSLTTPPCTEQVNWNILSAHVPISAGQINAFKRIFPNSTRPIQPLNGRKIKTM